MVTGHRVDGKNPAPVDRWFIPLFIGIQPYAGFVPSTVFTISFVYTVNCLLYIYIYNVC